MKKLIYKIAGYTSVYNHETEEAEQQLSLAEVIVENPSDADIERAKEIAYNGIYTIEDDGQQDPISTPTTEERVEALEAAVIMLSMPDVSEV